MRISKKLARVSWLMFFGALVLFIDFACIGDNDNLQQLVEQQQPPVQSAFLKYPDEAKKYVEGSVAFWEQAIDPVNGGYFRDIDREGNTTNIREKSMLAQSRHAFGFAKAFMLTGKQAYLDKAHEALAPLYQYGWDQVNGGWFIDFTEDWKKLDTSGNTNKSSFYQHYGLLGIRAVVEAHPNNIDGQWYKTALDLLHNKLWDYTPETEGYFAVADFDWNNPRNRSFHSSADGITVHGLADYLLSGTEENKARLLKSADNVVNRIVARMDDPAVLFGFPENYNTDWSVRTDRTNTSTGHILKAAWGLAEVYRVEPDRRYMEASTKIVHEVLSHSLPGHEAYDHVHGGPFGGYTWSTGMRRPPTSSEKRWWMLEEAFNIGITAWYTTGQLEFLEMADESIDFYVKHFLDHEFGGVYTSTTAEGEALDTRKAHRFKASYHSIELGYYAYLYGKLLYQREPATLHYRLEAKINDYEVTLTPLPPEYCLSIEDVKLNGEEYDDFDADTRTIKVEAAEGGIFKVTFGINEDDCT